MPFYNSEFRAAALTEQKISVIGIVFLMNAEVLKSELQKDMFPY